GLRGHGTGPQDSASWHLRHQSKLLLCSGRRGKATPPSGPTGHQTLVDRHGRPAPSTVGPSTRDRGGEPLGECTRLSHLARGRGQASSRNPELFLVVRPSIFARE